ncbi:MAG: hypothetical protein ACKVT0_02470 [Planctomycetaceae bacterium]
MPHLLVRIGICIGLIVLVFVSASLLIQGDEKESPSDVDGKSETSPTTQSPAIEITPATLAVDPLSPIPAELQVLVTVKFNETPLSDVMQWMQKEHRIDILIDKNTLDYEFKPDLPITDHLENQPLYLLLDHLESHELSWYVQDEIVFVTFQSQDILELVTYPVGDLFEAGYDPHALKKTILTETSGLWEADGNGEGHLDLFDDIFFIRQTNRVHREISELLAVLRDTTQNPHFLGYTELGSLLEKLEQRVSVNFQAMPLNLALEDLAKKVGVVFKLDDESLAENGLTIDRPVTMKLTDKKLSIVLDSMLRPSELAVIPVESNFLIVPQGECSDLLHTGIYNVSDICQDERAARGLARILTHHTSGLWQHDGDGEGMLDFLRPGTLIVRQTWDVHLQIKRLLNRHRADIKNADRSHNDALSHRDIYTHFYKMPTPLARDLLKTLPQLVQPLTWKNKENPQAIGTIHLMISEPVRDLRSLDQPKKSGEEQTVKPAEKPKMIPHSVLIVHQDRDVHEEIDRFIRRSKIWDIHSSQPFTGWGFFSISDQLEAVD